MHSALIAVALMHFQNPIAVQLADLDRFPPKVYVQANRNAAVAHLNWLGSRARFSDTKLELESLYRRQWKRFHVWDLLSDAYNKQFYEGVRLNRLRLLRKIIGEEAYAVGDMPDPVPWWTFPIRP